MDRFIVERTSVNYDTNLSTVGWGDDRNPNNISIMKIGWVSSLKPTYRALPIDTTMTEY